jgi:protein-L-isoaspartate(D-aspartate) O-methyltransferase
MGQWQRTDSVVDYATRRTMMVDTQVRPSDVTKFPIIQAMLTVPRERFVPPARREAAYAGAHLDIAPGRVILDPRTFAKLLDALDIQPGDVVLDLGCAWGYSTAIIARLADFVVGLEDDPARAEEAQTLLSENGTDNATVVTGPLTEGSQRCGPYDAILIEGAVEQIPSAILDQLKPGGRIACIWAEGAVGVARIGHKADSGLNWRPAFNAGAPVLPGFARAPAFAL